MSFIIDICGESFTGFTLNINNSESVAKPSLAKIEILISPLKFSFGITTKRLSIISICEFPSADAENVISSPSISAATNSRLNSTSSKPF